MSLSPKLPLGLRYRTVLVWLLVGLVVWSVTSYWLEYSENAARRARERLAPPLGSVCRVVFSGDDLGIANMSPRSTTINGVENSLTGILVDQSERWLVLQPVSAETSTAKIWIPRERVLLIRVE